MKSLVFFCLGFLLCYTAFLFTSATRGDTAFTVSLFWGVFLCSSIFFGKLFSKITLLVVSCMLVFYSIYDVLDLYQESTATDASLLANYFIDAHIFPSTKYEDLLSRIKFVWIAIIFTILWLSIFSIVPSRKKKKSIQSRQENRQEQKESNLKTIENAVG